MEENLESAVKECEENKFYVKVSFVVGPPTKTSAAQLSGASRFSWRVSNLSFTLAHSQCSHIFSENFVAVGQLVLLLY